MSDTVLVALIGAVALLAQALINRRWNDQTRHAVDVVEIKVDAVKAETAEINDAVNHKAHGMPTLVQRVTDQDSASRRLAAELAEFREWQQSVFEVMAEQMGVALPEQPAAAVTRPVVLPQPGTL